jgi:uncharacterized protein (DUF1778 family)
MTKFPTATTANQPATRVVNLRVRADIRNLIDWAAQSQGKSRSEFMVDAARRAAEDALLDQPADKRLMNLTEKLSIAPNPAPLGEPAAHMEPQTGRCAADLFQAVWSEGGMDIEAPPDLPVDDVKLD